MKRHDRTSPVLAALLATRPVIAAGKAPAGFVDSAGWLNLFGEVGYEITSGAVAHALHGWSATAGEVHVRLNSGGGDCAEGTAIAALFRAHAAPVHVHVIGMAGSAAAYIALAADRLSLAKDATLFFHMPDGGYNEQMLEVYAGIIIGQIAEAAGMTDDAVREWIAEGVTLTAADAVERGLATIEAYDMPQPVAASMAKIAALAKRRGNIGTGIAANFKPKAEGKQMDKEAIKKLVEEYGSDIAMSAFTGTDEDASDEDVAAFAASLKAAADKDAELAEAKAKAETAERENIELKAANAKLVAGYVRPSAGDPAAHDEAKAAQAKAVGVEARKLMDAHGMTYLMAFAEATRRSKSQK